MLPRLLWQVHGIGSRPRSAEEERHAGSIERSFNATPPLNGRGGVMWLW